MTNVTIPCPPIFAVWGKACIKRTDYSDSVLWIGIITCFISAILACFLMYFIQRLKKSSYRKLRILLCVYVLVESMTRCSNWIFKFGYFDVNSIPSRLKTISNNVALLFLQLTQSKYIQTWICTIYLHNEKLEKFYNKFFNYFDLTNTLVSVIFCVIAIAVYNKLIVKWNISFTGFISIILSAIMIALGVFAFGRMAKNGCSIQIISFSVVVTAQTLGSTLRFITSFWENLDFQTTLDAADARQCFGYLFPDMLIIYTTQIMQALYVFSQRKREQIEDETDRMLDDQDDQISNYTVEQV